jgi:hypothetical protein
VPGLNGGFEDWHPMKGPMLTQTLQDIVGKEPHHWRGDRDGIEEFNPAFMGLLGDDQVLSAAEMQEFEDFLRRSTTRRTPSGTSTTRCPRACRCPGTTRRALRSGRAAAAER